MITKKQLLERIEKLSEKTEEMQKVIDFITTYDKDSIRMGSRSESSPYFCNDYKSYLTAEYIKNGKLFRTIIRTPYYVEEENISILEKIDCDTYIIKCGTYKNGLLVDKYFQLTKSSGTLIDITEIKERFENQEKVSQNLKDSAQAIGEAVKDFFGCQKNKKTAKPKVAETKKSSATGTKKKKERK